MEPVAWAVFDGPDRMHLAPGYGEAESCAEDIGGEIVPLYRSPRWIPVSERLPEINVSVLVCWENRTAVRPVSIATFQGEKSSCGKCLFWYDGYGAMYASHWMPLPEPPEVKR